MIKTVANFIDKYNLGGKTIVLGFSGGFDSICLLDILIKLRKEKNITIISAHLNHNWRAEMSNIEQERCRVFCKKHKVEFYTETLPDNAKKTETVARELRYDFFERVMLKYSADAIFTAHNYDDNAETILYRIFKGTGIVGLQGIQDKRGYYYRPLLNIKRDDIVQYCLENNLEPNDDSSNYNTKYKRNLIRCEILPMIEKINPEIKKTINNLALVSQSECRIIDEYVDNIMSDVCDGLKIDANKYVSLSDDVKKRIIYNLIYKTDIDYDYSKILDIYNFIEETLANGHPSKMSLSTNNWLYVDSLNIEFIQKHKKNNDIIKINEVGVYNFGNDVFEIETCKKRMAVLDEFVAYVDLKDFNNIVLRTRRDGDIITPLGSSGSLKLKKYLIDKKIPQHKRDKLLLLCSGKNVLWVAGVGLSDKIKVIDKPTHKLRIEYNGGNILW